MKIYGKLLLLSSAMGMGSTVAFTGPSVTSPSKLQSSSKTILNAEMRRFGDVSPSARERERERQEYDKYNRDVYGERRYAGGNDYTYRSQGDNFYNRTYRSPNDRTYRNVNDRYNSRGPYERTYSRYGSGYGGGYGGYGSGDNSYYNDSRYDRSYRTGVGVYDSNSRFYDRFRSPSDTYYYRDGGRSSYSPYRNGYNGYNNYRSTGGDLALRSPMGGRYMDSGLNRGQRRTTEEVWLNMEPISVQGGSLRTCAINEGVERVQLVMNTEGRPLMSTVELWQGPDNSPQKMDIYLEDGDLRPFRAIIETPGSSNAISIRNTAEMEFPLGAGVEPDYDPVGPATFLTRSESRRTVQGGAVYTTPFAPEVASVQIMLKTDGRPLNARIELLQGPNNNKQTMDIYTEDGEERPFVMVLDTPGVGNVVRIVNTATVEFPLLATVEPYLIDNRSPSTGSYEGDMTWS